ncbi:MAG: hypothetical protein WBN96_13460, partial [Gammaproteobacteria bacterium]
PRPQNHGAHGTPYVTQTRSPDERFTSSGDNARQTSNSPDEIQPHPGYVPHFSFFTIHFSLSLRGGRY